MRKEFWVVFLTASLTFSAPVPKPKPIPPVCKQDLIGWWYMGVAGERRFLVCLASDGYYYASSLAGDMRWHGSWCIGKDGKSIVCHERVMDDDSPGQTWPWTVPVTKGRDRKIVGREGWRVERVKMP